MSKYRIYLLLVLSTLALSCSRHSNSFIITTGSDLSPNGEITNKSLNYTFKITKKEKRVIDIIDSIYFSGDTFCFSVKLNSKIDLSEISFSLEDINTKKKYKIERFEWKEGSFYGFSLIGTILEQRYKELLHKDAATLPRQISIPIKIIVKENKNPKTREATETFTIKITVETNS